MLKEEIASYHYCSQGKRVKDVWFHKPVLGCKDQYETIKLLTNDDVRDMVAFFLPLPHDLPTNSVAANNVDD